MNKVKHFEELWEEAEKVAEEFYKKYPENEPWKSGDGPTEDHAALVGAELFRLCYICKKYNINSFTALQDIMNEYKIDLLEDL